MHVDDAQLRDFLIHSGSLSRRELEEVDGGESSLYEALVRRGTLPADELRKAVAHVLGVSFVVLGPGDISVEALLQVPEPIARVHNIVAFRTTDSSLEVALLDLDDLPSVQFLEIEKGVRVVPRITTAESIKRALMLYHKHLKEKFGEKIKDNDAALGADALLSHAMLHRASTVYFSRREFLSGQANAGGEEENSLLVRYRIAGKLYDAMTLPREAVNIVERLKELAGLSFTLHTMQEGSFKVSLENKHDVRVRVSSIPSIRGEGTVLHLTPLLGSLGQKGFTLESLGFHNEALEAVHTVLAKKAGLIAVLGPQGSGVTTTLYTMLDLAASPSTVATTIEESVSYHLPQVTQTVVRPEIGLTMAAGLRSLMKTDPDIVMIDAIHDAHVATLAQSAARRGMLVLAGVDAPLKGADVVVRVRAVSKVCQNCKEDFKLSRVESEPFEAAGANFGKVLSALKEEGVVEAGAQWKDITFARAVGCSECDGGYTGNTGLQEVALKGEIVGLNLAEDALFKVAQGVTSIEEVLRVL